MVGSTFWILPEKILRWTWDTLNPDADFLGSAASWQEPKRPHKQKDPTSHGFFYLKSQVAHNHGSLYPKAPTVPRLSTYPKLPKVRSQVIHSKPQLESLHNLGQFLEALGRILIFMWPLGAPTRRQSSLEGLLSLPALALPAC